MEAITYEELMDVNGGRRTRGAGSVRGRRTSWWSRHKKRAIRTGKAVVTGGSIGWKIGTTFGRIVTSIFMN